MELHGMLKNVEDIMLNIKGSIALALFLAIGHSVVAKTKKLSHPKVKGKAMVRSSNQGFKSNAENEIAPNTDSKEATCFYCQEKGHFRPSCSKYLEGVKKKRPRVLALHVFL